MLYSMILCTSSVLDVMLYDMLDEMVYGMLDMICYDLDVMCVSIMHTSLDVILNRTVHNV